MKHSVSNIFIPESWSELTEKQTRKAFALILKLSAGQLTPFQFQLDFLYFVFGKKLKPPRVHRFKKFVLWICYSKPRYQGYIADVALAREMFEQSVILIAENLNFAFTLNENKIHLNYDFEKNPFPHLSDHEPTFTRKYTVETNITPKQFSDCLDCIREVNPDMDNDERKHFLAKIAETLYKISFEKAKALPDEVLFGISMWFIGISSFFHRHPVYGILFSRSKNENSEDSGDKISLGMSETILHIQKQGYGNMQDMNVIDFFNAQIKSLKDNISSSIAAGVKIDALMKSTGLDADTINKLS